MVEMTSRQSQKVECLVQEFPLYIGVCVTHVNIYVTSLHHYDVIFWMDWLESHWDVLTCQRKTLTFSSDEGQFIVLHGKKRHVSL